MRRSSAGPSRCRSITRSLAQPAPRHGAGRARRAGHEPAARARRHGHPRRRLSSLRRRMRRAARPRFVAGQRAQLRPASTSSSASSTCSGAAVRRRACRRRPAAAAAGSRTSARSAASRCLVFVFLLLVLPAISPQRRRRRPRRLADRRWHRTAGLLGIVRHPACEMLHGWIILDKPVGLGSTQRSARSSACCAKPASRRPRSATAARSTRSRSGVLPIALGEATKLAGRMLDATKAYDFTIRFGEETDTLDARRQGGRDERRPPDAGARSRPSFRASPARSSRSRRPTRR